MSSPNGLDALDARDWRRWAPPPQLTLSQWADRERTLPPESSAEPGRWRTSRVPYLREPMDAIADRQVETVVLMAGSQVGKTEVLLNLVGYHMHLDPCPMLFISPTLEMSAAVSKDRIAPMIRDTPALRGIVAAPRSRDASNTTRHKAFAGGTLTLAGANSPASLASRPIRVLLADELDRWPASIGGEGDPLTLAMKRTSTFRRRKAVLVSSPTVKGASRVEDWWAISDQRRFHTPCPRCGVLFVIAWEHVRWEEGDPRTAHLECPHCLGRIEDLERPKMMAAGSWEATAPFQGVAGFHIWEMFAPWRTLVDQVGAFLAARRSLETRQAWTNTALGQLWEAPGERVEPSSLLLRREQYPAELPAGVQVLTCGVDTQDDRLEAVVVGWGAGEESWIIARETDMGDPARPDVWRDLDELLATEWQHELGGTMRVQCTLVDAGGHRTQSVYSAVIPRQVRRVFASFGRANGGEKGFLVSPPKAIRPANGTGNVMRRIVDVDQCKALIFSRLRLVDHGAGYVHFPLSLGETFFDELTAETLVTKRNKYGVPTKTWEQTRERNESLDCFVLSLAALRVLAPTPARFDKLAGDLDTVRQGIHVPAPARSPRPGGQWLSRRQP
jgi:phage terminase large subunit GpA-like protein